MLLSLELQLALTFLAVTLASWKQQKTGMTKTAGQRTTSLHLHGKQQNNHQPPQHLKPTTTKSLNNIRYVHKVSHGSAKVLQGLC